MKRHPVMVLVLSLLALHARAAGDLTFKDAKVETPSLSLSARAAGGPLTLTSPGWDRTTSKTSAAVSRARYYPAAGTDLIASSSDQERVLRSLAPMSLSESLKQPPLFFSNPGRDPVPALFQSDPLGSVSTKRFMSRMPVVTPSGDVDKNMPIKAPDSSIDYTLMVKTPDVESAK